MPSQITHYLLRLVEMQESFGNMVDRSIADKDWGHLRPLC